MTNRTADSRGAPLPRIARLMLGIGVALLLAALVTNVVISRSWAARSERAPGTIVDYRAAGSSRGSTYCPIAAYTVGGKQHTVESVCVGDLIQGPFERGQAVYVRHHPDDPSNAVIDSPIARWTYVVMLLVLSLFFSLLGLLGWRRNAS